MAREVAMTTPPVPDSLSTPILTSLTTSNTLSTPDLTAQELQNIATSQPVTEKHRYIQMRSFPSEQEKDRLTLSTASRWAHMRPDSVLVTSISNHWRPGCWQKVVDMIMYSQTQGYYVALQEIQDRCFNPYDALGTMRNEAVLQAQIEGFEWLLMVDTDVKPERDTLIKLLSHQMPIIAPYVVEPGTGRRLFGPSWDPNQGVKPLRWTVLSMVLFRTTVFNCFPYGQFWADAVGADEGYHFMKLWHMGHQPWQDTSTIVIVEGTPHYPLASNRMSSDQRRSLWDKINLSRNKPPDRRPGEVDTPTHLDGEYHPYIDDSRMVVTATPANDYAINNLTGAEKEAIMDEIIHERTEPPDRAPIDPNTPNIEGEYLPFAPQTAQQIASSLPAPAVSAGWRGA